jgi:hypothetical protein
VTGDYTRELAAADAMISGHLGELTNIPHVAAVKLDNCNSDGIAPKSPHKKRPAAVTDCNLAEDGGL